MEWVGLIVWLMVMGIALPVAITGLPSSPGLVLQGLFGTLGIVFCILYIIEGDEWMAWTSAAMALVGAASTLAGASWLVQDGGTGSVGDEIAAGLAGMEIPLMLTAMFSLILAAGGVTTVS